LLLIFKKPADLYIDLVILSLNHLLKKLKPRLFSKFKVNQLSLKTKSSIYKIEFLFTFLKRNSGAWTRSRGPAFRWWVCGKGFSAQTHPVH